MPRSFPKAVTSADRYPDLTAMQVADSMPGAAQDMMSPVAAADVPAAMLSALKRYEDMQQGG